MAKSDFPETFRRESTSEVTPPTCADEETKAIGGERTPTGLFKQVAPATGRIQIFLATPGLTMALRWPHFSAFDHFTLCQSLQLQTSLPV